MTQVPAGWFPDPAPPAPGQPPLVRYWDGRQWTEHVQPAQQPVQPPPAPRPGYPPRAPRPAATDHGTTPDGVPLAGWWQRVGGYVIDSIAVGIASSIVTVPIQVGAQERLQAVLDRFTRASTNGSAPQLWAFMRDYVDALAPVLRWSVLVSFVAWLLYYGLFLRFRSATPGMMALGLAVRLRETPGRLAWSTILVRIVVQQGIVLVALVSLPLYVALSWFPLLDGLWPLWDAHKQALHDKAARTNVVRTRR